ncbi:hypothetical protein BPOR_0462g00090 [Botrytis porri]|uniref:Uncharacterized protein n=1 Tax=Botrytis porri TaxID=87229 RepID=A0A4Z1KRR0_9HELO|nr:hypothetical protein BPOR_0462g00090 [Botrytis porri]
MNGRGANDKAIEAITEFSQPKPRDRYSGDPASGKMVDITLRDIVIADIAEPRKIPDMSTKYTVVGTTVVEVAEPHSAVPRMGTM